MCCSYGNGSYTVSYNGTVVASGGSFASSETLHQLAVVLCQLLVA